MFLKWLLCYGVSISYCTVQTCKKKKKKDWKEFVGKKMRPIVNYAGVFFPAHPLGHKRYKRTKEFMLLNKLFLVRD